MSRIIFSLLSSNRIGKIIFKKKYAKTTHYHHHHRAAAAAVKTTKNGRRSMTTTRTTNRRINPPSMHFGGGKFRVFFLFFFLSLFASSSLSESTINNEAIAKALTETFPGDAERANLLAREIQEELNVTAEDKFDVQTFADVEADGLRVVAESFVATTYPISANNFSMKFVAISEQLTPNASYGAVVCGFAHPERCISSPMMGRADDFDEYRCGRADVDVKETSHFCELIAEGDTNDRGEIVFIGTPTLVSLQQIRKNETGDENEEPPLLLHIALVRLPPTPEEEAKDEERQQTPARKLLQGLGGGIGFGGGIGGINRFGVGGLGVSSLGGINNIVAQDPLFEGGAYGAEHVAFAQPGFSGLRG
jgi:hypothetical protein